MTLTPEQEADIETIKQYAEDVRKVIFRGVESSLLNAVDVLLGIIEGGEADGK